MSPSGEWVTEGFAAFRSGTFGNAGQNLYVSAAGVLQRIHLFDFNKDGWVDLAVCNHKTFSEHRGGSSVLWRGPGGCDLGRVMRAAVAYA